MANSEKKDESKTRPPQEQRRPGEESKMRPRPRVVRREYRGSGKLEGKVALITGGDSGIGRSIAVHFAREGADVAFVYLCEDGDARETQRLVEAEGRRCLAIRGDLGDEPFAAEVIRRVIGRLEHLDVLVNNAAEQHPRGSLEEIDAGQLERTFRTNIFAYFYLTKAALEHLRGRDGAAIVNTTSVTAYRGSAHLIDYSATKGAIVAFTRSLSQALVGDGIRVNAVAPGPIWTPLIPSTFSPEEVESFGADVPMKRPGEPDEVATCFVFLASDDASYMTGQVLHPNGGGFISS